MENNKPNTKNSVPTSRMDAEKKKRKYSLTVMTSTVLIVVAVIILNIIFAVLADRVNLNVDLTKDGILSFSEKTEEIVNGLDMDVKIISLIPESDDTREVIQIDEILKKYDVMSDKITYQRVDAKRNPAMLTKYEIDGKALENDYNIIFESERMYYVVNIQDILIQYLHNNYADLVLSGALRAEQYFTTAINKVTKGSNIHACVLTGHGEKFNSEDFKKHIMPGFGVEFKDIALMSGDIPADTDFIIVASPETDYTEAEIAKIDSYMRAGGDIKIIVDHTSYGLYNLFNYMREWGVSVGDGIVADAGLSSHSQSPLTILASVPKSDIVTPMGLEGNNIVFSLARPLTVKETVNTACTVLATTSDEGYIKNNLDSGFDTFEPGDIKAKSNLAVLLTRQYSFEEASNMTVIGSSMFFGEYNSKDFTILGKTGNRSLITGLVNYMTDQPSIIIAPKNIYQGEFVIDQMSIYIYTIITVVLVPLSILAFGLIIWLKRRHS